MLWSSTQLFTIFIAFEPYTFIEFNVVVEAELSIFRWLLLNVIDYKHGRGTPLLL
jgi:hypothetical protein